MVSTPRGGELLSACGSYTYTVSLTGYDTASGSFNRHGGRHYEAAAKPSPSHSPRPQRPPDTDITVTVTVRPSDRRKPGTTVRFITVPTDPAPTVWTVIEEALDKAGLRCVKKETDDMGLSLKASTDWEWSTRPDGYILSMAMSRS
jgi:hypothetical protein